MLQNRTKATIILIGILLLGVILGSVGSRFIVQNRIERMARMRQQEGFVRMFEYMIDPSDSQTDTVRTILRKHHERFREINMEHRENVQIVIDSMRAELQPYLTEKQILRLTERFERGPMMGKRRPFGPRRKKPLF